MLRKYYEKISGPTYYQKCISDQDFYDSESINSRRGMKNLLPIQVPPISPMDRMSLQLPFSPTDLIWRYPLSFPPPSQLTSSSPLIDFKTHLPTSLATDPRLWNRDDVNTFIKWCEREFDLPTFDMDMFQMNGKAMCLLTKTDLAERCPGAGDVLHNVLQMLVRDSQILQRCLPSSPVTPTSRYPLSPHGPHPPTPNWSLLPPENPFHNSHLAHFMSQSNSVTLSPAPSVDSQQGSPQHVDAAAANYAHTIFGHSSGSNQSDSDEDYQEQNNGAATTSPPNTPALASIAQPPRSPKDPSSQNMSTGAYLSRPVSREFFPDTPEPNTNGRLLWDFLQQLLNDPNQRYTSHIAWKNRDTGIFKIVDPQGLAKLWGIQKNHLSMNYDKMSRALRYYYRVNILKKVQGERHCYQFLRNPTDLKNVKNISSLRQQIPPTKPPAQLAPANNIVQQIQQQNSYTTMPSLVPMSIKSEPNTDMEDNKHNAESSHNQQHQQHSHPQQHHRSSNYKEDEEMPTDLSMVSSAQSADQRPTDLSAKMDKHRISMIVGDSYSSNGLTTNSNSK